MIKRILTLLVLVTMTATWARADLGGYVLRNVTIDAVAHENGYWDITETLKVDFLSERHGIYKYIPSIFNYSFKTSDGQTIENVYQNGIDVLDVAGYEYSTKEDATAAENTIIQIGSEDKWVSGLQTYVITYRVRYLNDRYDGEDFLCHTIWGDGWEAPTDTLQFSIKFDKPLPEDFGETFHVYSGARGVAINADSVLCVFDAATNTLHGAVTDLPGQHAITVSARLPEGYWTATGKSRVLFYLFLALTIAAAGYYLYQIMVSRRSDPVPVVTFYPPEDLSSAEVGKIIDDTVDTEDLASLIPWFASQGFITIEEIPDRKGRTGKHADLKLHKRIPLPPDAPRYQQLFMDALFDGSKTVTMSKLGDRHSEISAARTALNNAFYGERELVTYDHKSRKTLIAVYLLALLTYSAAHIVRVFDFVLPTMAVFSSVGAAAIIAVMRSMYSINRYNRTTFQKVKHYAAAIIIALVGLGIHLAMTKILTCVDGVWIQLFGMALVALAFTAHRVASSTEYRVKVMGELLGLREFIKTAELPRLKMLVDENPSYFYDVLPYAMVFGLSDKWVKQFASIDMESPDWYRCDTSMGIMSTAYLASSITSSITNNITSSIAKASVDPSSSESSGGYSGGGSSYSGGGGGGGGGGSW